jgi:preprotein translocase subunit SecD
MASSRLAQAKLVRPSLSKTKLKQKARTVLTGITFAFAYMCIHYLHHIHGERE